MRAFIPGRWGCTCGAFRWLLRSATPRSLRDRARCNREMPEGDTIFRTARALGRALIDKQVTGFRSTYPMLMRFDDDSPLAGQTVERVEPRGKWLLIYFSGGGTLATHM